MDNKLFNDQQIIRILSPFGDPGKLRVLYVSCYRPDYIRTESVIGILKRNNIQFTFVSGGSSIFRHSAALVRSVFYFRKYNVILLAFRGHELLPVLRLITGKPIIFDAFVSVYDTLCLDRKIFRPDALTGRFLKWYDRVLCRMADCVLVDTGTHAGYFKEEFNAGNVTHLYLECGDIFRPTAQPPALSEAPRCVCTHKRAASYPFTTAGGEKNNNTFVVFWYGNCWPLQGIEVMLKAADILKNEQGLTFRFAGPVKKKYGDLISRMDCRAVEFIDYIPYTELPSAIAGADLCLGGHFSDIPKAKRVIAGKAFQFFACGKRMILGDNPANRELFSETPGVYFVRMNSAEDLAAKIREIKNEGCSYEPG